MKGTKCRRMSATSVFNTKIPLKNIRGAKMRKKLSSKQNVVQIGNLTVVSHTQELKEVVKAADFLIKKHRNLIESENGFRPRSMFG